MTPAEKIPCQLIIILFRVTVVRNATNLINNA